VTWVLIVLVGIVLGLGGFVALLLWVLVPMIHRLTAYFQNEIRVANDRLYASVKDDRIIPPRELVEPPKPRPVTLLPEKVAAYIGNWESAETRAELTTEATRLIEQGYSEERIVALFEARREPLTAEG
jgi:hypothetical protein